MSVSCDVYDYVNPVNRRETRRARKPHSCNACGGEIRKGDTYLLHVCGGPEGFEQVKRCPRCELIHRHLSWLMRRSDEFPEWRLDCGHTYEQRWGTEPPPEIAALAFWVPGDPLPAVNACEYPAYIHGRGWRWNVEECSQVGPGYSWGSPIDRCSWRRTDSDEPFLASEAAP